MSNEIDSGQPTDGNRLPDGIEDALSFGDFLRRERLREHRTLAEEATATGVPGIYLEALEENEFDRLPPAIYVRGYLSTFARAHELSPDDLYNRFECACRARRMARGESPGTIFGLFSPPGEKFQWRDWSVPIILSLAVIAYMVISSMVPADNGTADQGGVTAEDTMPPPQPAPSPPPTNQNQFIDQLQGAAVRVTLRAEAVTRVSAAVDGGETMEWTMQSGETRHLDAAEEIVVSLGNAGAVRLNYNGRELGFIGDKGEVKRAVRFVAGRDE